MLPTSLSPKTVRRATAAWLLAPLMRAAAQSTPKMKKEEVKCGKPLAAAVVVDDQIDTPAWISDQIRSFHLQIPAQTLRKALLPGGCFLILDGGMGSHCLNPAIILMSKEYDLA